MTDDHLEQFAFQQKPQCWWCYWYIGGMKCRAFNRFSMEPEIPIDVMSSGIPHNVPLDGDNGRQFVNRYEVQAGRAPAPEDW